MPERAARAAWRERAVWGALALLVLALGGFAWLTGHPEAPIVDRAVGWPLVGPLAERFRARWRPPPPAPEPHPSAPEVVILWLPPPPEMDGGPVALSDGATRASATSEVVEPFRGRQVEPPLPLPALAAEPSRVARAEALLEGRLVHSSLGPYRLVADARLAGSFARWSELAAALDAAFAERNGLAPLGEPAETVALFESVAAYRELQREESRLAGLEASGHAAAGLAAMYVEGRSAAEVEATLVHELAHFVHRRALGPALPPWLDEGLAEDLAQTPFDAGRQRFALGELRADVERDGGRILVRGGLAGLDLLVAAIERGELPSLAALTAMDWEAFVGVHGPLRYAQSLFLLRFLLDSGDPLLARGTREFLAGVARGDSAGGERLFELLGVPPLELESRFALWVAAERQRRFAAAAIPARARFQREPSGSSSRQDEAPSP